MTHETILYQLQERLRELRGNVSAAADLTNAMDILLAELTAPPPVEPPPPVDPPPVEAGMRLIARHPTVGIDSDRLENDLRHDHPKEWARFAVVRDGETYLRSLLEKGEHAWSIGSKIDLCGPKDPGLRAVRFTAELWVDGYPFGNRKGGGKIVGVGSRQNAGGGRTGVRDKDGRVRLVNDPGTRKNPFTGKIDWCMDGGHSCRWMRTEASDDGLALKLYAYPQDRASKGASQNGGKTYGLSPLEKGIKGIPPKTWVTVEQILVLNEPEKADGQGVLLVEGKPHSILRNVCWQFHNETEGWAVSGLADMFGGNPEDLPAPRRMEQRLRNASWWGGSRDDGMALIDDLRK